MSINIFTSSRMKEGSIEKEKRDLAKDAIEDLGENFKPILFEYEPAASEHTKDWWRSRIKEEDTKFLVLILNDTLSAGVFDEFRTASEYGVKIFVFLIDEKFVLNENLEIIDYPESGLIVSRDERDWFYRRIKSIKFKKIKGDTEFKKNIKDAISQYLVVSPEVPHELKANIFSTEDPELKRILKVYVKPVKYDDAHSLLIKNRFLLIAGDANIGKTAMAQHLAYRMKSDYNLSRMIKIEGGRTDITLLKNVKNSVIVFDDVFGRSDFADSGDYAGNIKEIIDLKENNFVILTSRREILNEAKTIPTRFAEYFQNIEGDLIEINQEGSYSDIALRKILENHLSYYYEIGKISDKEAEIADNNTGKIIKKLRFPHNIDIFVKEELKKVIGGEKDLDDAIESAKHIKTISKNWFLNLDDRRKYFAFTIALFPGLDEKVFDRIYEKIVKVLQKRHKSLISDELDTLRKDTSSYVTKMGRIDFAHPNYWEGVWEGVEEKSKSDLFEIFPALKELAKDDNRVVRRGVADVLRWIGTSKPEEALLILEELEEDDDAVVRRGVVDALRWIGTSKPEEAFRILKNLARDDNAIVRMGAIYAIMEIRKIEPAEIHLTLAEQL